MEIFKVQISIDFSTNIFNILDSVPQTPIKSICPTFSNFPKFLRKFG